MISMSQVKSRSGIGHVPLLNVNALVVHFRVVQTVVPILALGAVKPPLLAVVVCEQLGPVLTRHPIPFGRVGRRATRVSSAPRTILAPANAVLGPGRMARAQIAAALVFRRRLCCRMHHDSRSRDFDVRTKMRIT